MWSSDDSVGLVVVTGCLKGKEPSSDVVVVVFTNLKV